MAKFRCEKCKKEKNILKQTLVFLDGDIRAKESKCECGEWMKDIENYKGFGTSFQAPTDKY
tara:strand:- start:569 stop:751 length:183 start_codon:yes stop_codon:yes gene_type:complete